jgi:hypothetical protein
MEILDSVGEKGYLLRRSLINIESNKLLNTKLAKSNKKRSQALSISSVNNDVLKINHEYSNLEKLSKVKKISSNDLDIDLIKKKLKRRFLRSSIKKNKFIPFNTTISTRRNLSNELISSSNNISKIKKTSKDIKKGGKLKLKNVLNELNELTDKLGITKQSERENYINVKDKRNIYQDEIQKEFKDKGEKKLQLFTSTAKLNRFLINDYYMSEFNQNSDLAKKKLQISEMTYEQINKERMKSVYEKSQNVVIADIDRDTFYYNLTHQVNDDDYNNKRSYSQSDMKKIKDNYYNKLSKERLNNNLKLFSKIRSLNNEEYISINPINEIEYSNLDRVIKIKKYRQKCINQNLTKKKEKLKNDEEIVLLCLSRFKQKNSAHKQFRISTLNQYKSVSGLYFGLPV